MGEFSADRAITAGFRLIGREPAAFLVWIVAYLVIGVAPQMGAFALILPQWSRLMQEVAASAASNSTMNSAAMMRAQFGMLQLEPLIWITSLVSHTVLFAAVYRAVLFPEDRRFFYLRLGGRELWLGLVLMVLVVMAFLLMLVTMLPTGIAIGLMAALSRGAPGVQFLAFPLVFAVLAAVVWVLLRLSLAPPQSFAERGFRLYESWDLTRGHAGKMFLVVLAFVVMAWIVEAILAAVLLGLAGGFADPASLWTWVQHPRVDLAAIAPWLVAGGLAVGVLSVGFITLFAAGWAEIYRDLTREPTA